MEVVLLIRNVAPDKYGGGESYQLELANQLRQNNFYPIVMTSSERLLLEAKKQRIKAVKMPYLKLQNWSGWRNVLLPLYGIWQIRLKRWYKKIFKKYQPTVVNIQSRDDWIAATLVAKKMKIRVLWTDHADFRAWVLVNVNVRHKNLIGKWILKCANSVDKIILISNYERRWFNEQVAPRRFKNVVTIKNGVCDRYSEYEDVNVEEKSFCYIGRLVDCKGIMDLLQAFQKLKEIIPEARLNIYGDGGIEKYKKVAGDGVKFYGYTSNPLLAIAKNEIFVLPSHHEGLSIALLEAIMMKKKIIATKVGGNPEVVVDGETGLLVSPRDVEQLTKAMVVMVQNKKFADQMAAKARKFYEENYNFGKIFTEKMLALYNNSEEKR